MQNFFIFSPDEENDTAPMFAYRRILGLEMKDRQKRTVYIESEFLEMFNPYTLSDVINQALNIFAIRTGRVVGIYDDEEKDQP